MTDHIRKTISHPLGYPEQKRDDEGMFKCDLCGERTKGIKCRGMILCPECREEARDYFGR